MLICGMMRVILSNGLKNGVLMMKQFEVVDEPIDINRYHEYTIDEKQGAVCMFTGHVREWTKGTRTVHLEYEAYHFYPIAAIVELIKHMNVHMD